MSDKEYRTHKQFEEIVESCTNGNWTQASKECEEFGFYANDLIKAQEQAKEDGTFCFEGEKDIALLAELATELRYK